MAKKKAKVKKKAPKVKVVGKVERCKLDLVNPNPWNPNEMTKVEHASLKAGLDEDGWLASKAMLVWGTDEKRKKRNVIIDGEQRWTVAQKTGFKIGPMVFLHGLTEAKAKALTIKMDQKRGQFNSEKLGILVREIDAGASIDNLSLNLGIQADTVTQLLKVPGVIEPVTSTNNVATLVPLYYSAQVKDEFTEIVTELSQRWSLETTSDVVLRALAEAS